MRKLFLVPLFLGIVALSMGQPLLIEDFDYTAGEQLISADDWFLQQTNNNDPILVSDGGLSYPGYIGSGIGNAAIVGPTNQDLFRGFTKTSDGSLYLSCMINVTLASESPEYFLSFKESSTSATNTNYRGRIFAKRDASDNLSFGVAKGTGGDVYTDFIYSLNTTYLVVMKYTFNPAAGDDVVELFINPVPGGSEPTSDLSATDSNSEMGMGSVLLRQGSGGATVIVDGIRVATTWEQAVAAESGEEPADLFISEVADPGDEYKGRFVEIFNPTVSDVDLSAGNYYIVRQANGGSTADIQLTGTIEAGTAYVVATNATDFESFYGFAPDMANGSVTGSGDDGYFLYIGGGYSTGTLLDIYGVIDEDGTDKPWEYLDSRASRVYGINTPNTTWTASEWEIVSANVADMDPGVHAPVQDLFAPEWADGYPKAINIIETGFDIAVSLDETSTVYYVIMAAGGTEPTVEEVKAGTGPSGATAVVAGTITAGTSEATETITDLTTDQEYSVYLVAEDDEDTPNTQAAVTTFNVTPVIPPSVLYLADFETSIDPFTQFSEAGAKTWAQEDGYMTMSGYNTNEDQIDWLISPEIDLTNVTEAQLIFDGYRRYGLYDETHFLKLYYSEDYDGNTANIGIATWVEISFTYPVSENSWEEIGPIDISSVTGTAYFAFVYNYPNTGQYDAATWRIDDAQILGYSPETAVATLDELNVDGALVDGFDAAKPSYVVELPAGTSTVPAVTWTLTNENATAVLTVATDLSGDEAARTTTVEVTSQDETVVTEYTILFNPILEVANLGELRAATDDTRKYTVTGEVVLTQKDGFMNKKYFEDATGAIEIYDPNPAVITTVYEIGDGVTGLTGTLNEYFGMLELEPTEDPGTASSTGNTVEPQVVTVSDFVTNHEDYEAEFVKIEGVTFADAGGTFDDLKNYVVSVGEDLTVFRTHFTGILSSAIPTMADIQGIAVWHYDEAKVAPRMASDLMAYSADATLTDLAVDGTTVTGFDAATLDYAVELPMGTTVVPTVTYALSDDNAEVDQTDATNLTGTEAERTTSVVVTSQDGTTENTYTIVFTVSDVSVELNNISKLTVYPVPTANQLFVEGLENSENIKIVDIAGKVLLSEQATGDKMVFDVGGLEGGIYMIITETSVHKFVKK